MNCITKVLAQSEKDKEKYIALGLNENKVINTGNIKFAIYNSRNNDKQEKIQIKTINNYVTQLRADELYANYFDEINVQAIQSEQMGQKTVSHFDISCR